MNKTTAPTQLTRTENAINAAFQLKRAAHAAGRAEEHLDRATQGAWDEEDRALNTLTDAIYALTYPEPPEDPALATDHDCCQ